MIPTHCAGCGKHFRIKPEYAGRLVKCPSCGQKLQVPTRASLPKQSTEESKTPPSQPPRTPEGTAKPPMPAVAVASSAVSNGTPDAVGKRQDHRLKPLFIGLGAGAFILVGFGMLALTGLGLLGLVWALGTTAPVPSEVGSLTQAPSEEPILAQREIETAKAAPPEAKAATPKKRKNPKPGDRKTAARASKKPPPAADTPVKSPPLSATKGAKNAKAPVGTASLLPEEQTLLKLASNKHYYNREGMLPGSPYEHPLLMLGYISIPVPNAHSKVADLVVFKQQMNDAFYEATNTRSDLAAELPARWANTVLQGMTDGLRGKESLSFDEFRRGPGEPWEKWGDRLREQEIVRAKSTVLMTYSAVEIARVTDAYFGPRVAKKPFSDPLPFLIYPRWGDEVGAMYEGKRVYASGWYAKITYQGQEPLTNVMLVSHLITNGPSTALTDGQNLTIATNKATYGLLNSDGDKQIKQIERMFKVQNYYNTMPKSMFVFLPVVKPGDVIHMPLGDFFIPVSRVSRQGSTVTESLTSEVPPGARLTLYCDQGFFKDRPLELTRWMLEGSKKEVVDVIKPGMTRAAVTTLLGELDKTDRAAWLAAGKTKTLPEDADYWRWGDSQYKPVLYLAFRGDVIDTLELVIPPRPKPTFAGVPLKPDSKGGAKVKSTLKWDDPKYKNRAPAKVYTMPFTAGKKYTITLSSTDDTPVVSLEDEYGGNLSIFATGKPLPVKTKSGFPTGPLIHEATVDFTPREDGEYRVVANWLLSSSRGGEFTLTVRRK